MEVFIDPDGDGKNYIEIGVNAFSSGYDMLLKRIASNCGGWSTSMAFDIAGMETAGKITLEGFDTEIKIPLSSLEGIKMVILVHQKLEPNGKEILLELITVT